MTHRKKIGTQLLVGGLLAPAGPGRPRQPTERRAASQLTAVGKLASASLACHATTAAKQEPPDPCLLKATLASERTWAAEEAEGGCATAVTPDDVETEVVRVATTAVPEITGAPEDASLTASAARVCAADKLRATIDRNQKDRRVVSVHPPTQQGGLQNAS
jgi:hypothetical protein